MKVLDILDHRLNSVGIEFAAGRCVATSGRGSIRGIDRVNDGAAILPHTGGGVGIDDERRHDDEVELSRVPLPREQYNVFPLVAIVSAGGHEHWPCAGR